MNEFAHFCATDFMQESTVEIEHFATNCEAVRDLTAFVKLMFMITFCMVAMLL